VAAGIPARLTPREGRRFAFTVGTAFLVFAGIAWWRDHPLAFKVLAGLGGVLLVLGAAIPSRLGPVYRAWMGLAHAISKVTTPIFMGIVYFLVLTPAGLLRRTLSKNPLTAARTPQTVWVERSSAAGDLERQF
jgi:hypothetical protein